MERYNNKTLKRLQKAGIDDREDVVIIFVSATLFMLIKLLISFGREMLISVNSYQ